MKSIYINKIVDLFNSKYFINEKRFRNILSFIFEKNYSIYDIQNILKKNYIFNKKRKDETSKRRDRISTIQEMIKSANINTKTMNVLDIGSGNAEITKTIKNFYNLKSKNLFALDEKTPYSSEYSKVFYDNSWNILMADEKVDVIILFNIIHHVNPTEREKLFSEIYRVLKPGGVVIVREHDSNFDSNFEVFLNLVHIFWYEIKDEKVEEMWVFSKETLNEMFTYFGFSFLNYEFYETKNNLQRLYYVAYTK